MLRKWPGTPALLGMAKRKLEFVALMLERPTRIPHYLAIRIFAALMPETVPVRPLWIDVEPANDCNLRCEHCQVTHWQKARRHLDRAGFTRILAQFPRLLRMNLQGMGEPLLNKELLSMLREGESRGVRMGFTTNGTIMTPKIAEQLVQLRRTNLQISVDGATAATFEKMRPGSHFEKVTANVRMLLRLRGRRRGLRVQTWTVLTRDNLSEVSGIVRLAKQLGADAAGLQPFLSDWGKRSLTEYIRAIRAGASDLDARLEQAKATARKEGMHVHVTTKDLLSRERPCKWPWTSAYVCSNGDVVPCCIVGDSDTVKLGNLFEEDFGAIWNSRAYRELRARIRNHDLPSYCRNCYER